MQWWSLSDLYSVMSQYDLERLLDGEIIEGQPQGVAPTAAYLETANYCDRAQRQVAELLGSRAPLDAEQVPALVTECVVVRAAYHLSFKSDLPDLQEKLARRLSSSEKLIANLRDRTDAPRTEETAIHVISGERRFSLGR